MSCERVIALIDMDCFYCQVEVRNNPELQGKPLAVVQYSAWKGGAIIAVNYEARAFGVTGQMRGDEAKKLCPDIILAQVPVVREKADLNKYRQAGRSVIQTLLKFGAIVERASVDEAYIDLTKLVDNKIADLSKADCLKQPRDTTFVVGQENEKCRELWFKETLNSVDEEGSISDNARLHIGSGIVEEMRAAVLKETTYKCSAGIAHSKVLAKFACGMNKPNKQTILPKEEVAALFNKVKIGKVRGLGGKLGDSVCESLQVETMGDLAKLSLNDIQVHFDQKTALWLWNIARGVDNEEVKERDLAKSIGCGKNFRGPEILDTREKVEKWMGSLCQELSDRLVMDKEDYQRQAKTLHVSLNLENIGHVSRSGPLFSYDSPKIAKQAMLLISKFNELPADNPNWQPKLGNISISASKFSEVEDKPTSVSKFFQQGEPANDNLEEAKAKAEDDTARQAEELVPNLENYDPSLLEMLPKKLRNAIEKRVEFLQKYIKDPVVEHGEKVAVELEQSLTNKNKNLDFENETEECPKCGKQISPFEMPEHLDFHLAKELQNEIRREAVVCKRKASNAPEVTHDGKKQKTIDGFFKRQ